MDNIFWYCVIILVLAFGVGYRPSSYWKLKKVRGVDVCPSCSKVDVDTTLSGNYFNHCCNKCGYNRSVKD